jgi:hypothetical protein
VEQAASVAQDRRYVALCTVRGPLVADGVDTEPMKRNLLMVLGVLLLLVGALWTLQGLGVVGGSAMSDVRLWAVVGPLVAVAGAAVLARAARRPS